MSIDRRLRVLIVLTLLPLVAFAAFGGRLLAKSQHDTVERSARSSVRAVVVALEGELRGVVGALELLAGAPSLDTGDLRTFRTEAERALAARSGEWSNIALSDPATGDLIFDARSPRTRRSPAQEPETILEAARTRAPQIGNVQFGEISKQHVFAVRVPVVRAGEVRYVLSAIVALPFVIRLVDRQALPDGWAIAVLDGNYRFVARRPAAMGSDHASESLKNALRRSSEGWQRGQLFDGTPVYRSFVRSSESPWSVSIAIPKAAVDASQGPAWLLVAGFAAALLVGLAIAWWLASRISRPIAALVGAAPAIAQGERPAMEGVASIDEVVQLSRALTRAADEVRARSEVQRQAEQALRAADRAKDEFLAMLGHELRNPLASMSNAARLLKLAPDKADLRSHATEILDRQIGHMAHLVDDLLDVGRVSAGKIELARVPLELGSAVTQLLDTWHASGRLRDYTLERDIGVAWISADRERIAQITSNLLDNALKYTSAGGRISVRVRRDGQNAVLEIGDSGEGIPAHLIGRIFDLFVQGERSLAREKSGLGIGLTMVKRLVELHDGTVAARSDGPGRGATFTATFPAVEPPSGLVSGRAPAHAHRARRLLVVEDNDDARESLVELLRLCGHEVHAAGAGGRGIELAPECMLVDIGLPDVNGYEVARKVKQDPRTAGIRLIALTGYGMREDKLQAERAGFDAHATKPIELETLDGLLEG